ncbi:MAG: SRPBCC domain-containing protein [Flavisolibacter sp.]
MQTADQRTINIQYLFNASPQIIWTAWTDPAFIIQWFGSDPNGKGLSAQLDVRPGGSFKVSFADADGSVHTCSGIYVEVHKPNKLSFTWSWKNEPGVQSLVTVLLIPSRRENSNAVDTFKSRWRIPT